MITFDKADSERLIDTYLVSNTPAYLYKKLSAMPFVQRLARERSAAELMAAYNEVAQKTERAVDEVAAGYAALVALTLGEYGAANRLLSELRSYDLDWGPRILQIFNSRLSSVSMGNLSAAHGASAKDIEGKRFELLSKASTTKQAIDDAPAFPTVRK